VNGSPLEPVNRADVVDAYLAHAKLALPDAHRLGAMRIAVDTANGATTAVAQTLFRDFGFDVCALGSHPDGRNINLDCGSTHPNLLAAAVREQRCRMGVAFDGDGDRAIFVDAAGRVVDGDAVLLMCARHMQSQGRLKGNAVVATVMSNIGLELALRESGIELVRTSVGDKYVMEEMLKRGLSIGGEQSGHIIFSDHLFTGDGIVTALNVLRVMADSGRELSDLASELVTYPQVLVNVRVREKKDLSTAPAVVDAMNRIEERLAGQGRLLVRYSGTEPLLRIMIEGRDQHEIQHWAGEIANAVKHELA
jgi:phosphoglucosamine mutase